MDKISTTKTFPVRKEFTRVQTATVGTAYSPPKDLSDIVAVVKDVFVEG